MIIDIKLIYNKAFLQIVKLCFKKYSSDKILFFKTYYLSILFNIMVFMKMTSMYIQ